MSWADTHKIPDTRRLISNLLAFIVASQSEAFAWANGGTSLKSFAAVYNNASGRVIESFPSLLVAQDRFTTPYDVEVLATDWTLVLEIAIEGGNATKLTVEARKYAAAIESMLRNILAATLLAESNLDSCKLEKIDTEFDVIGKGVKSEYAQVFYLTPRFTLYSSAN